MGRFALPRLRRLWIYRIWPLGERGIRALRFIETVFTWLPRPAGVGHQPLSAVRRAKTKWWQDGIELPGSRIPIDAPLTAFLPTFLTVAELELVEPDVSAFAERLHRAGTLVQTHRWRRHVHAFPVLARLLPEGGEAITLTGEFLRATLA